jgi:hypothetical protein
MASKEFNVDIDLEYGSKINSFGEKEGIILELGGDNVLRSEFAVDFGSSYQALLGTAAYMDIINVIDLSRLSVGEILTDSATIGFTYDNSTPSIEAYLQDTTVTAGSYGGTGTVAGFDVDAQGRITGVTEYTIDASDLLLNNNEWLYSYDKAGNQQGLIKVSEYNLVELQLLLHFHQ